MQYQIHKRTWAISTPVETISTTHIYITMSSIEDILVAHTVEIGAYACHRFR